MGLPHVVVRYYTNPDGRAARRTTVAVLGLLGLFYLLPPIYAALGRVYSDGTASDVLVLELPQLMLPGIGGELLSALVTRSEEHTSELQSLMRISYAVFCLKKKKTTKQENTVHERINRRQHDRHKRKTTLESRR